MASDGSETLSGGPLRVHGSEASYFTGKLEAYLRYKQIPYERIGATPDDLMAPTGTRQIPGVELADGRWLTDTTRILAWFETQVPEPVVIPHDPVQGFFSRLVEDYGDEWLWRPAMHYRWSYRRDALLLSRNLADELTGNVPAPGMLKRALIRRRQHTHFVRRDGVRGETWDHVEQGYRRALQLMGGILADRPFLLGGAPSLADFGFFGSMFRHFGIDPTPASIMRETATDVYAWLARVWDAKAEGWPGGFDEGIPEAWGPLLVEIGETHLEQLAANAEAWKQGQGKFEVEIQGVCYRDLRTARYRVACLEALRRHFRALPDPARAEAQTRLEGTGCWEPLWRVEVPASGLDGDDPFAESGSMTGFGR